MEHQTIFSPKYIKRKIDNFLSEKIKDKDDKIKAITIWQENINSGKIIKQKEEELQSLFLYTFFGDILGYDYKNSTRWNLSIETRTQFDAKKSDGALGYFKIDKQNNINQDIRAVIELKNARTALDKPQNRKNFKGTPVEQAFMYASKVGESCKWVIVSNFLEIRLYQANDINKYESFNIAELTLDYEFARFYYLLAKGRLFLQRQNSVIEEALAQRIEKEQKISHEFYAEYKILREFFVQHLIIHNKKKHEPLKLLEFAQTIIDRIIFISVIKDYNLISHNIISLIKNRAESSFARDDEELWRELKSLFVAMDEGMPPRVHKFNGGLFKKNIEIDNLIIKDKFLKYLLHLSRYDFESELNINILGHVFEQSIADIENLKIHIQKNNFENLTDNIDTLLQNKIEVEINERKKYGIYYTPEQITKYIVKETIRTWLDEKKEKIGLNKVFDNDKEKDKQLELWYKYADILRDIKILDPACGSGAFLTQTYDFLFREWQILIDIIQKIKGVLPVIKTNASLDIQTQNIPKRFQDFNIKKNIVSNNIFGIDINNESVEITKLGLWLKTASKQDSLAVLESNIKIGNSLIDDKKIANEKAFVWEKEFKKILNNGGFDIIIGNPPYIRQEILDKKEKEFLIKRYPQTGNALADLYVYFYEKAIEVLKPNGNLSFITSNRWFKTKYGKKLRKYLKNMDIRKVIDFFENKIFKDASIDTQIILLKNKKITAKFDYYPIVELSDFEDFNYEPIKIDTTDFNGSEWIFAKPEQYKLLKKMFVNSVSLKDYTNDGINYGIKTGLNKAFIIDKKTKEEIIETEIKRGITTGLNEAFIIDKETKEKIVKNDYKSSDLIKPYAVPTNIKQYYLEKTNESYIIFTRRGTDIDLYPGIKDYLLKFKNDLEPKTSRKQKIGRKTGNYKWFEIQDTIKYYEKFEQPKIIYIHTALNHAFYYDTEGYYVNNSCYIIANADKFLSIFLNSKKFEFYKHLTFASYGNPKNKGRSQLDYNKMINVPIPIITQKQKTEFELLHDNITKQYQQFYKEKNTFIEILKSKLKIKKLNRKIKLWYLLDWEDFNTELEKLKIKLSLKKTKEWNEFFNSELYNIRPIILEINKIEEKINQKINQLYK